MPRNVWIMWLVMAACIIGVTETRNMRGVPGGIIGATCYACYSLGKHERRPR
jgi:hypothetical protein